MATPLPTYPLPYEMTEIGIGYRVDEAPIPCSYCGAEATTHWYHPDEVRDVNTCAHHTTYVRSTVKPLIDQWWAKAAYNDGWRPAAR